ncbi:MAG TPA: flavodoxin [Candidatus Cloacimonetes bacterium]|nr:flavodoxin [Candidatus Cloacimonadota bacterium]
MTNNMEKVIIIYSNTISETVELVGYLCRAIRKAGVCDVTIKKITETDINDLYNYDKILLASAICGNDQLQNEFIDFYEEMKGLDLIGKKVAAFGIGDNSMSCFCSVNTILEDRLKRCGAEIISGFKIEEDLYELKTNI